MSLADVDLNALRRFLDDAAPRGRTMLLPALHYAQSLYGWLPEDVQREISSALLVPLADVHGVIAFYTMFYNEPTARRVVRICEDPACQLRDSAGVMEAVSAELGLQVGETSADGQVTLEYVPCLGMCEHAPCALNGARPAGNLTPTDIPAFLNNTYPEPDPKIYGEPRLTLVRAGIVDPTSLPDYETHGGFQDLRRALGMKPDEIIALLKDSGIVGRGGAMFPLGLKWDFTRKAPGTPAQKHIIANADESEPGTFKDRVLMEQDPFSLIEAMLLAAYAIGAENGWIFVRGEYPRSHRRLAQAI
ncbi:MAG: NAD(P)H-dependent oxidoreductase subunit E, partial [Anaerolineales bacterium]|nr:NAD(P)H-dependent oxidoreductase subunit E [Anaerolineales bacterium]